MEDLNVNSKDSEVLAINEAETIPDNNPPVDKTEKQGVLLIHRVFIVYFVRHLRRIQSFYKQTFLRNNTSILSGTFDKFMCSKEVSNTIAMLEQNHGADFLLLETSVPWITNGAFIKLSDIPIEIIRKYTNEPNRLRGKRRAVDALTTPANKQVRGTVANNIWNYITVQSVEPEMYTSQVEDCHPDSNVSTMNDTCNDVSEGLSLGLYAFNLKPKPAVNLSILNSGTNLVPTFQSGSLLICNCCLMFRIRTH